MNKNKIITSLYDQYKNTNKKLKIICDWDEVIQVHEPYALWKAIGTETAFNETFKKFWSEGSCPIEYSPYGSTIGGKVNTNKEGYIMSSVGVDPKLSKKQQEIKNSPDFYQQAPFLTIAEDLLKLIREDKVEQIIFLSTYDKRKFPNGDNRKVDIFNETFRNFWIQGLKHEKRLCWLELIPFESEQKGQTKADWIKENASDFDIVIDDNPNICKSLLPPKNCKDCSEVAETHDDCMGCSDCWDARCSKCEKMDKTVIAPYYPATENQHHKEVLLIKNEVSGLKKEDFK